MGEPATGSHSGGRATGSTAAAGNRAADRDWGLFQDWCAATGRDPDRADGRDLAAFIRECPASVPVQNQRVRRIQQALGWPVTGLPRPMVAAPARPGGQSWVSFAEAMAGVRHEWFPEGVAARRDALVLVLVGHGFTRDRVRRLRPRDVSVFPEVVVDGLVLAPSRWPVVCGPCAVVRWLAVLAAFRDRVGRDVEDLLTQARAGAVRVPGHDCGAGMGEGWRSAPWLVPAVDRHGAIAPGRPVTSRAVTGILTRRFTPTPGLGPDQPAIVDERMASVSGVRVSREERDEIADLYARVEAEADALNARIQALLADLPG